MRGRGELDKQSETVLYGRGVTREDTEQYKQVEAILSCLYLDRSANRSNTGQSGRRQDGKCT